MSAGASRKRTVAIVLVLGVMFGLALLSSYLSQKPGDTGPQRAHYTFTKGRFEGTSEEIKAVRQVAALWGAYPNVTSLGSSGAYMGLERGNALDWAMVLVPHGLYQAGLGSLAATATPQEMEHTLALDVAGLSLVSQAGVSLRGGKLRVKLTTVPIEERKRVSDPNQPWPLFPHEVKVAELAAALRAWVDYRTPSLAGKDMDVHIDGHLLLKVGARASQFAMERSSVEAAELQVVVGEAEQLPRDQAYAKRWQLAQDKKLPARWASVAFVDVAAVADAAVLETVTASAKIVSATLAFEKVDTANRQWQMRLAVPPGWKDTTGVANLRHDPNTEVPILSVTLAADAELTQDEVRALETMVRFAFPNQLYYDARFSPVLVERDDGLILSHWDASVAAKVRAEAQAATSADKQAAAWSKLGELHYASGQFEQARASFSAAVRALYWSGWYAETTLVKYGMAETAAALMAELAEQHPADWSIARVRASVAAKAGAPEDAQEILVACLDAQQAPISVQIILSLSHRLARLAETASEKLESKLAQLASTAADGRYDATLAQVALALGRREDAVDHMRAAVAKTPEFSIEVEGRGYVPLVWGQIATKGFYSAKSIGQLGGRLVALVSGSGKGSEVVAVDGWGAVEQLAWGPKSAAGRLSHAYVAPSGVLYWLEERSVGGTRTVTLRAAPRGDVFPPSAWTMAVSKDSRFNVNKPISVTGTSVVLPFSNVGGKEHRHGFVRLALLANGHMRVVGETFLAQAPIAVTPDGRGSLAYIAEHGAGKASERGIYLPAGKITDTQSRVSQDLQYQVSDRLKLVGSEIGAARVYVLPAPRCVRISVQASSVSSKTKPSSL